jgi:hypothetical protein
MGFLFAQQGKMDDATKWYAQAVALNSQSCLANYAYAVSLFKGRLDDDAGARAEQSLRAAIKIQPDFAPAYSALGWLLATRHKDLQEAYTMVLTSTSLEPGDLHYRLTAVHVLEVMNRTDDAVRVAQLAVGMAKTPAEQVEAESVLMNAQQYQGFQQQAQERAEAFKKEQANVVTASPSSQPDLSNTPARQPSAPDQNSDHPPVLQHRDASAPAASPRLPAAAVVDTHPARPELLPTRKALQGTIAEATCHSVSTLEIALSTPTGTLQLFSDNYFTVAYNALNYTPEKILNPCTDLKGRHASVTYHPTKGQANQGEVLEIGLSR